MKKLLMIFLGLVLITGCATSPKSAEADEELFGGVCTIDSVDGELPGALPDCE